MPLSGVSYIAFLAVSSLISVSILWNVSPQSKNSSSGTSVSLGSWHETSADGRGSVGKSEMLSMSSSFFRMKKSLEFEQPYFSEV